MRRDEQTPGFSSALAALKRRGSALLVVGAVPTEAYRRASTWLLGDPAADRPRRRLVVVPDRSVSSATDRLDGSGSLDPERGGVVVCNGHSRGASTASGAGRTGAGAATGAGGTPPGAPGSAHRLPGLGRDPAEPGRPGRPERRSPAGPAGDDPDGRPAAGGTAGPGGDVPVPVRWVETTPGAIGSAVEAEFRRLTAVDEVEPGELRLAFDPLEDLLERSELEPVFRLCHVLGNRIRAYGGISHVRLQRPSDDRAVRTLAPLFDGIVELRLDGDRLQHRWQLRDSGCESSWLDME